MTEQAGDGFMEHMIRNLTGRPNMLDGLRSENVTEVEEQAERVAREAARAAIRSDLSEEDIATLQAARDSSRDITVEEYHRQRTRRYNEKYAEGWAAFQDGKQCRQCPYINENHEDHPMHSGTAAESTNWWTAGWQDAMWEVLKTAPTQPGGPQMQPYSAEMNRNQPPVPEPLGEEPEPEPEEVVHPGSQIPRRAIDVGE